MIPSSSMSGYGSSQVGSAKRFGGRLEWRLGAAGGRRPASLSASRHRLVAILYSHARSDACPRNRCRPRQAPSIVSWRASTSCIEPRIG